jgi:hypothetical protein
MQAHLSTYLSSGDDDPLALSLRPPIFETHDERTARLAIEGRAKAISDGIDEELEQARALERKGPKAIKILLLGVSKSISS